MNIQQLQALLQIQAIRSFRSAPIENSYATDSFASVFAEWLKNDEPTTPAMTKRKRPLPVMPTNKWIILHKNVETLIQKAAQTYNVPKKLIKAIIQHESNFNPMAVSRAGASGYMQLMPSTAKALGVTNIFDPEQNIMAGTKYLRQLLDQFNGDLDLALAAYNAGPGNVKKHGGIPPFKETIAYVQKVKEAFLA
ncbi:lytic transglycosylase domain-containing protein [Aeribacillus pallidus]|uniref:lytic transglycosylase domain-containing protein n=1 Tax=Aeribacillus pallidus TaxID=33936 RepID=UPI003D254CE0